jgi:GH24 family phage-related lysozyme (muramidase)
MTEVNSYKLSMTYQGAQPEIQPADLGIDVNAPFQLSATDQILDLSTGSNLEAELMQQDLSLVKGIKVGSVYLSAPNAAVLKTLVEQLKSVCLDTKGKLRSDFQYVSFESKTNPTLANQPITSSLLLNVIGPEPNDGYVNTSQRDMIGGQHLIQPNDNLVNIARLIYGGSEGEVLKNAQRLANFNGFADPNKIPSGKTLYLIDDNFLKTVSAAPPKTISEVDPATTDESTSAIGDGSFDEESGASVILDRGSEIYTENPPTLNGLMHFMGKDAFALVENYEHSKDKMYWDGGKKGVGYPTIGVGHLIRPGEKFNGKNLMTTQLSSAEIEQLFIKDLREHAEPLIDHLKPEVLNSLNRNQLTALASLAFNIGPGGIDKKGRKLGFKYSPVVTALNGPGTLAERVDKASDGFARHIFSKGKRLQGLVSRRLGERTLFVRPDANPADLPGYDRPKLKAYIDQLNQSDTQPDVRYADMWPVAKTKPKKAKSK